MRKPPAVALLGAGRVAQSFIGRLPDLADHLGPVKSFSFRVASRTANALRAGRAVSGFDEFEATGLILICVPEPMIGCAVDDMCQSTVQWRGKTVVLCEAWQDASALRPLAARGALTASLNAVPGFAERLFVADGERGAFREIKRLLLSRSARVVRLNSSSKLLYMAGITIAGLSGHLAAASSDCLRAAGLSVALTRPVVHALSIDSIRSFVKAGRKGLGPRLTPAERKRLRQQCSSLERKDPELARRYKALTSILLGLTTEDNVAESPERPDSRTASQNRDAN
jgi:hypothetical protein